MTAWETPTGPKLSGEARRRANRAQPGGRGEAGGRGRRVDAARRAAAQLALWLAASMFIGAFAASLAAIEGGQLRDGVWDRSWRGRRPYQTHAHT
jgi:hypothetical protein